jgi:hypothetical protein
LIQAACPSYPLISYQAINSPRFCCNHPTNAAFAAQSSAGKFLSADMFLHHPRKEKTMTATYHQPDDGDTEIRWCQMRSENDVWFYTNTFAVKDRAAFQRFCQEHCLEWFEDKEASGLVGCYSLEECIPDEIFVRQVGTYLADDHVALISDISECTWHAHPPTVWQIVYAVNNKQEVRIFNPSSIFSAGSLLGTHMRGFKDMSPCRSKSAQTAEQMREEPQDATILMELGNGYTLRYGKDLVETAFICVNAKDGRVVDYCYWDYKQLRVERDSAPERVLGGLLRAGIPILDKDAIIHKLLEVLTRLPAG